ncbi:MAG: hypothetical protein AAF206_00245 [Bacteroidota bacterium]
MSEKQKPNALQIAAVVLCVIGCSLLAAPVFIESELDLRTFGLAFNGAGLFAFLFGRNAGKAS